MGALSFYPFVGHPVFEGRSSPAIAEEWKVAVQLLNKIQTLCPEAVIAGGAVRDLDHVQRFRDLDIFIHWGATDYDMGEKISKLLGASTINLDVDDTYKRMGSNVVAYECWPYWFPVQIICVSWNKKTFVESVLESVDIDLCMIAFDGKQFITHDSYEYAVENKTISAGEFVPEHKVHGINERLRKLENRYKKLGYSVPKYVQREF